MTWPPHFDTDFRPFNSSNPAPIWLCYFNIVDYVPGYSPNCQKFRTYRNWNCEVEVFWRSEPKTQPVVFNWGGFSYNPLYDPAANCAARFAKVLRQ
jgi:hypothetical protein